MYPIIGIVSQHLTHTVCSTPTVEAILIEITQRSQRGAEPAEGLLTEKVGLAWLQQQRASLEVHVHLTQLLQTAIGPSTHEHWSSYHQVIQTREASRRQIIGVDRGNIEGEERRSWEVKIDRR